MIKWVNLPGAPMAVATESAHFMNHSFRGQQVQLAASYFKGLISLYQCICRRFTADSSLCPPIIPPGRSGCMDHKWALLGGSGLYSRRAEAAWWEVK